VPRQLDGRGIGSALIGSALRSPRERGLKVVLECSFAAAYMKRHPEMQDLQAAD
jgi:predicted GNAT family acetyltransferase